MRADWDGGGVKMGNRTSRKRGRRREKVEGMEKGGKKGRREEGKKKERRMGIDGDGDEEEGLCVGWHKQIEWKRRQKLLNLRIKEGGERGDRDKHR